MLNLPQDVTGFINSLPRSPADLDIIVIRKEGATDTHEDFRVRRSVVLHAGTSVVGGKQCLLS